MLNSDNRQQCQKEKCKTSTNRSPQRSTKVSKRANAQGVLQQQPYLQQLSRYDNRDIDKYRTNINLSKDIAVKLLRTGMLSQQSDTEIRQKIDIFLTPDAGTLSHGRPIHSHEARTCGLAIKDINVTSDVWMKIYQLHARLDAFVSRSASKIYECKEDSFHASIPR